MIWPRYQPLGLFRRAASKRVGAKREPVEAFLSAEPPRTIAFRQGFTHDLSPMGDAEQAVVASWWATRAWVYRAQVVPEREGPTWKLDVVFVVDGRPVLANFEDTSDKMHGVGGAATHDRWYRSLMNQIGSAATVLHDRAGHCVLFGDLHPFVYWDFTDTLKLANEADDPDERRELVDICLGIVNDLEDVAKARQAVAHSGWTPLAGSHRDWCRKGYTENRLGGDLRPYLQRMQPVLTGVGAWMWAACIAEAEASS